MSLVQEELGWAALERLARASEQAGFRHAWNAELNGLDAVTMATMLALATHSMTIGTGVLNIYTRTPFEIALTAASLAGISRGRFRLGLGTSSELVVRDWNGVAFRRPLERARETIELVRALLTGQRTTYRGQSLCCRDARLAMPPSPSVPIYLAALGPRMVELAGRAADGVVLALASPECAAHAVSQVRDQKRGANQGFGVLGRIAVAWPGDDPNVLDKTRRLLATYALVPAYQEHLRRQGLARHVDSVERAYRSGGLRPATAAVSDDLLASVAVVGLPEEQARRIFQYVEAGVNEPSLTFVCVGSDPSDHEDQLTDAIRFFAGRLA